MSTILGELKMSEGSWIGVAEADEILEGGQKPVTIGGRRLLICRSDGQWFAVENRCSHDQEALFGGTIRKCTIVCPHHGARFHLGTGAAYGAPAFDPIRAYPTQEVDGQVRVLLPA